MGGRVYRRVAYSVGLLTELGPTPGFPHSSKIMGSSHSGMRELRTRSSGGPLRTLYAFDPLRVAILLVGGDKTGNDRWYGAVPDNTKKETIHPSCLFETFVNCEMLCRPNAGTG
jgi:hypothetical protein